jgi:hypothetical protein
VVNAILDACFRSARTRQWEPVDLAVWRAASPHPRITRPIREIDGLVLVKEERMPDGRLKRILQHRETGEVTEQVVG